MESNTGAGWRVQRTRPFPPILVSDLDAIRSSLGLPHMIPLGFSFGGGLALEYALAHPQSVHKLVLQAPSVAAPAQSALVQLEGFRRVATGDVARQVEVIRSTATPPEQQIDQVWEIVDRPTVDRFLFHDAEAAALNRRLWAESGLTNTGDMHLALAAQPTDPGQFRRIRDLQVPTLVMVGRHDRNVGIEVCQQLCGELPDARLVVFENSAHFPDIEEPLAYAAAVRAFMST